MDTECKSCLRKYVNVRLFWRCPRCAHHQMETAPSASANTASLKLPDYLELVKGIDDSRFTTMPGKELVMVGTRLMYDCIIRQLQA